MSQETVDPTFVYSPLCYNGYRLGQTIGEGSYSKVKIACKNLNNGNCLKVACKRINKKKASNEYVLKFLPREITILKSLCHPNIVRVFDTFESSNHVYIFTTLCERGDLLQYVKDNGALLELQAQQFFSEMVSAVHYLHHINIAHRDLKCENIFITDTDTIMLGDFGFSRCCVDLKTQRLTLSETFCGSTAYASPELLQGLPYNPKTYDIWSLGCVLYIMLTANMPFDDSSRKEMLRRQLSRGFEMKRFKLPQSAAQIINHMLDPEPLLRATIHEVANSAWIFEFFHNLP